MTRLAIGPAVAVAATLLLGLRAAEQPAAIDIGTLGGPYTFATAINNRAQVVGQSVDAAETRITAFLWQEGGMQDLSTGPLWFQLATDINNRGVIVGNGRDADGRSVPLVWDDGVLTALPMLPGTTFCSAEAINDRGDIVGGCDQQPGLGVLWRRTGGVVSLGPLPQGWTSAGAAEINDRGVIVGRAVDAAGGQRTWVFDDGRLTDVTDLPGGPLRLPTAINDRGAIVGWAGEGLVTYGALLEDGVIMPLPRPAGPTRTGAQGINRRGEVIGWDTTPVGSTAVVWTDGQMRVLPPSPRGSRSSFGADINDHGVAVGNYAAMIGETRAVLWPNAGKGGRKKQEEAR